MRVDLTLGWLRDPLVDQLQRQALPFAAETIAHLDKDADAVSRLRLRGIITDSQGDRAYDRIAKRVWQEVRRAERADRIGSPVIGDELKQARSVEDASGLNPILPKGEG